MRIYLLALGLAACSAPRHEAQVGRFVLVQTDSAAAARFHQHIDACASETTAFAALVASIPEGQPLPAQAADSADGILIGTTLSEETDEPLLGIDLADLERFPSTAEVRTWTAESSWAWTRCEALGHELAETIAYREAWQARPPNETLEQSRARFVERKRNAHVSGLRAEGQVAEAQATRRRADGEPYRRTRECFDGDVLYVVFGLNTETIVLGPGAVIGRVRYFPGRDLCAGL